MASPSELSLDCKPHSYSMLLKSFAEHQFPDQTQKLEEFLSRLEEERLKIDAFKRELPLCMQLLTNAVESSRQQLQASRGNNVTNGPTRPVLEEFIPLKTSSSEVSEKTANTSDKANWMISAQLWSQTSTNNDHQGIITKQQSTPSQIIKDQPHDHISFNNISPKLALDTTKLNRNNGGAGAFLPFSKERPSSLPELALAASIEKEGDLEDKKSCLELEGNNHSHDEKENENAMIIRRESGCGNNKIGIINGVMEQGKGLSSDGQTNNVSSNNNNGNNNNIVTNGSTTANNSNNNQTHRKARRCWSPDLHRRFVSALQVLGGSQVATPKQIRELMKVDGLTNDEVKSHLQKYRLHTRRPSPSPQTAGSPAPQLVVLGGIWVPPEYASAAAHAGGPGALYQAPPHYCGPPVPQEFYAAAQSPAMAHHHHQLHHHHQQQLHHHPQQQQLHQQHQISMYNKAASHAAQSSPESELRGGGAGDRSESIEDGKSESGSWKGESGDNGTGERKLGLAALREEGEESNGSEITLKF